jgi:hypothetical protein
MSGILGDLLRSFCPPMCADIGGLFVWLFEVGVDESVEVPCVEVAPDGDDL